VIFNLAVAGNGCVIGEDVVITNHAIMSDVYSHHQEITRADARSPTLATGAMQRAILSNQVVIADDEAALFAFELYVLRFASQNDMLKDAIALAHGCVFLDHCVGADLAPCADGHIAFDHSISVDAHVGPEQSLRADDSSGMNSHKGPGNRNLIAYKALKTKKARPTGNREGVGEKGSRGERGVALPHCLSPPLPFHLSVSLTF